MSKLSIHHFVHKLLFKLEPELAHNIAHLLLRSLAIVPQMISPLHKKQFITHHTIQQKLWNRDFFNPVGLAAGFDKNSTMVKGLCGFGFGFLELGTVTKIAQEGNIKPRLWRLKDHQSLQNSMGFNNDGADKIAYRLEQLYPFALPLGINIGKNKTTDNKDAIAEYVALVDTFKELCDYIVINISSPNTKDLRALQNKTFIKELLPQLKNITSQPILVKIAPDIDIKAVIELCQEAIQLGIAGIIATNTTNDYTIIPGVKELGGIGGQALKKKSNLFFKALAKELFGQTTLIAVGGIDNCDEAYERIKHGANLVQIYTALVYEGIDVIRTINKNLIVKLKQDGFSHISEAIGSAL